MYEQQSRMSWARETVQWRGRVEHASTCSLKMLQGGIRSNRILGVAVDRRYAGRPSKAAEGGSDGSQGRVLSEKAGVEDSRRHKQSKLPAGMLTKYESQAVWLDNANWHGWIWRCHWISPPGDPDRGAA